MPAPAQPELTELASAHFGWPEVADGVIAAAQGRLSQLESVPDLAQPAALAC